MDSQRNALVTGSTSGIGYAIAEALAAAGCDVVLNGFGDPDEIERMRLEIESRHGTTATYIAADMGVPQEIEALVATAAAQVGGIDILVNSAAEPESRQPVPIEDMSVSRWDRALAVNLSSAFHTIRLTIPHMRDRNWGRIVNIASSFALFGTRDKADYTATKTALVGLTRDVALEVAETGITCNAICPGWTLTPHQERNIGRHMEASGLSRDDAVKDMMRTRQPSGHFVLPEQIGGLVVFLCSDAAAEITGTAIPIDGGWAAS